MARNLVLCFDGTNNEFRKENTNVVRLVQTLSRDSTLQRLYYDPGVGTLPEPGFFTAAGKRLSKLGGLAFGAGLSRKVQGAYRYLMEIWQPDDHVFLFGFSRGAYTARVLAGLLHGMGLLPRGCDNLIPYVMHLFRSLPSHGDDVQRAKYFALCDEFRWTICKQVSPSDDSRRFPVHFMGLWDTVSSVGWAWNPRKYPYTAKNPSVTHIRHAVSIDERRWFFRQNLFSPAPEQDVEEQWFPGVHSDVGGGYAEEKGGLWRYPFTWILDEAEHAGLCVAKERRERVLHRSEPGARPFLDPQHESLTLWWWPAEFFPKVPFGRTLPCVGLGRHRPVPDGARISSSALERLRDMAAYDPPNLSPEFKDRVRSLPDVAGPATYGRGVHAGHGEPAARRK